MSEAKKTEFFSSIPVLLCQDLQKSIDFYVNNLGFSLIWLDDEGEDYAALIRDHAALHLALAREDEHQPSLQNKATCEPADVNFMVAAIDDLWQELQDKDIEQLLGPPVDQDYGVRDFSIVDPDGYQIRFNEVVS